MLVEELRAGESVSEAFQDRLVMIAERLNGVSGKKQYGYLPKGIKSLVDETVDMIAQDERVAELYDIWYQAKCSVYQTYTDKMPEKLPLSEEKAFKAIRNALVYEAAKLGQQLRRGVPQPDGRHDVQQKLTSKSDRTRLDSIRIRNAALRLFTNIAPIFENGFSKYDPADDEDIDRQLRREIRAVKDGIDLVM